MTYAAIDCGTNAIRLLLADVDADNRMHEVVRIMRVVRLGEGVDRTGAFAPQALARTFAACEEYASIIAAHQVRAMRFVATSASRDVSNRAAFVAGVRERLGVDPEVIAGAEEADLSFHGSLRGLPDSMLTRLDEPVLVVDIGGGSTEFILGQRIQRQWRPQVSASIDIGCVRMTERHLHGDPPTSSEVFATERDITAALDRVRATVPIDQANCLIGLAGTVTTVTAMAHDLDGYDPVRLHGAQASAAEVADVTDRLLRMTRAERAALPFMHPGRVDVIGGGAMVLRAIMRVTGVDSVIASECDLLDGVIWSLHASHAPGSHALGVGNS